MPSRRPSNRPPSNKPPADARPVAAYPTFADPLAPTAEFLDACSAGKGLGLEFEPGDLDKLGRFLAAMLEFNTVTNLTSITDPAQAWMKHILDAMTLLPVIISAGAARAEHDEAETRAPDEDTDQQSHDQPSSGGPFRVIDIGSGGGVPVVPLAIVLPDVQFTAVEATGKKADFLRAASRALKLNNLVVISERAERLGQDHKLHRERYDISMARALGHLAIVTELCGPLVRRNGLVIAIKGARAERELTESAKALGFIGLRHIETAVTPTGRLVILEKTIKTPRMYPRRDGEPARMPLGVERD
jgi:16S rRNA (guanine527-N7)-methyltransferase